MKSSLAPGVSLTFRYQVPETKTVGGAAAPPHAAPIRLTPRSSRVGRKPEDLGRAVAFWADWVRQYPIWSIEDGGLAEQDWGGGRLLAEKLGAKIKLGRRRHLLHEPGHRAAGHREGRRDSVLIRLTGSAR